MKASRLLLSALAGCISAEHNYRNFMTSCSGLELHPNRGLLIAFCSSLHSDEADHISQVDLNGCLGWGPSYHSNPPRKMEKENDLFPAKGQSCNSCHIIREGESTTQVGYILCNCAPKDSDVSLEYMYDLKKIVDVNGSGCLKCFDAPSLCSKVKDDELDSIVDGESTPSTSVPGLVDGKFSLFGPRNRTDISDCDGSVLRTLRRYPAAIPKTFQGLPIRPCESDRGPGLCCFYPMESNGFVQRAFHLIEDLTYVYRIDYSQDAGKFTRLNMVSRYCKYPERCPGGNPDDNVVPTAPIPSPRSPKPINTFTSTTSNTKSPSVSTRPASAGNVNKRGIRASTSSRNVTGIPDSYLPTPTLTNKTPTSEALSSAPLQSTSPALKIDLGKLDAPGLVDIMLDATNIEEVGNAQLKLYVKADCYTPAKGKLNCQKVVVEFTGHEIDGDCHGKSCPKSQTRPVKIRDAITAVPLSYVSNKIKTSTITVTTTSTRFFTLSTSTTVTTVSTQKTGDNTALPTSLSNRLRTPLPPASEPTVTPSRFGDTAQVVLGPRAITSTEELPGVRLSTTDNLSPPTSRTVTSPSATDEHFRPSSVHTTTVDGGNELKPSVIVTFVTEEQTLTSEVSTRSFRGRPSSRYCGLMGCPHDL